MFKIAKKREVYFVVVVVNDA